MEIKEAAPTVELTDVRRSARRTTGRALPPLEGGDRLTRREFERRYEAMPQVKKAELIEGVVYMPSPVRFEVHSEPHADIIAWLGMYRAATPGVRLGDNATLRLEGDNEVQPDAVMRLDPQAGGRSRVSADGYLEGSPELVAEVAASSAAYDVHDKLDVYRRNGVQEYVVWQVFDEKVDWFELRGGEYVPLAADDHGVIHSRVLPGLRLAVLALLEGDLGAVLAELQQGLASDEHSAFVERLKSASAN